jgi:hypothetical protein
MLDSQRLRYDVDKLVWRVSSKVVRRLVLLSPQELEGRNTQYDNAPGLKMIGHPSKSATVVFNVFEDIEHADDMKFAGEGRGEGLTNDLERFASRSAKIVDGGHVRLDSKHPAKRRKHGQVAATSTSHFRQPEAGGRAPSRKSVDGSCQDLSSRTTPPVLVLNLRHLLEDRRVQFLITP